MNRKRFGASNLSGAINSDRLKECHRRSITTNTGNRETASVLLLCLRVDDKTPSQTKWRNKQAELLCHFPHQRSSTQLPRPIYECPKARQWGFPTKGVYCNLNTFVVPSCTHNHDLGRDKDPRFALPQTRSESRAEISAVPYLI
ncbi:hypothetical protein N7455_006197 [Penicillium solitum]|uniref:uncharacterized protein n=1 Tax=Penicillium solitum TaxID=60172 RepID=UPI0032C423F9|nr:hypothetical protein N7455_006197 [Penicillium solitum]